MVGGITVILVLLVGAAIAGTWVNSAVPEPDWTSQYPTSSGIEPTTADHWHWAYGIFVCDGFIPALEDFGPDYSGIHTHNDWIIHIHPFSPEFAGDFAVLGEFFASTGVYVTPTSIEHPDRLTGEPTVDGRCPGGPAVVTAAIWNADDLGAPPLIVEANELDYLHFDDDRMAITIGLAPAGTKLPKPPSITTLDELTDVPSTNTPSGTVRPKVPAASAKGRPCVAANGVPFVEGKPVVEMPVGPPPTELEVIDLIEGTGAEVQPDATIRVHYVGIACSTGEQFDASWGGLGASQFPLTTVIEGWSQGLVGMKVGGRRQLNIPSEMAYGAKGQAPDIAPDEALVFVVDLVAIAG